MKSSPRLKAKGFTLIELIMTIVVVGIIAVPLSLLLSQHIQGVFDSADYTLANNLARFEMEVVNNLVYTNITSANIYPYQGYDYTVTRTVTYAQGSASTAESLKKVVIDVKKSGSISATVLTSLVTYIAKNVGYGL